MIPSDDPTAPPIPQGSSGQHLTLSARVTRALEVARIAQEAARAAGAERCEAALYNNAAVNLRVAEQMATLEVYEPALRHAEAARSLFFMSAQRATERC